jgi:hypothetical protein
MARLAWIASEVGSATNFSEGKTLYRRSLTRPGSGVLAGRYARYPPHSTPLFPSDAVTPTRSLLLWKRAHRRRAARIVAGRERGEESPGAPR